MTLISALFLIFIFSIQTIEATGPKDLNPEKTKADANLSQSSAASGAKNKIDLKKDPVTGMKKLSLEKKQALLKQIILEDASSSADLTEAEIQAIKLELGISENDFILKGLKITVEDDQLKIAGSLKDFIKNPNKIKALLNKAEFIEKIMEAIKAEHKLTGEYSYSLKMGDSDTGAFEIYFYKSPEDLVKEIILEDASSSADLTEGDIQEGIKLQVAINDFIPQGFKIGVQDDQLQADGSLKDFIANPSKIEAILNEAEFIEKIMEAIKAEHKVTGEYSYSLNMLDADTGSFEIYFYKNAAKSLKNLKNMIIADLENCRDLEESELQALKNDDKIYDSKYIENACEILIEDRNLANLIGENKVESFKDTDYKQEIADQLNKLNKANLNLDKHMSVYLKVKDMTQGQLGVILADTKREKKSALIEALKNHLNNSTDSDINKKAIEKAYGVEYINLGINLYLYEFKMGGEFDQSFALIDEILKNNTEVRTALIEKANKIRRSNWYIQQAIPNDSNTILRSRQLSSFFMIDVFTLSESPKGAIQSLLLDWIDINIIEYSDYESIRSSDAIKGFEAGRSLKQGLKIIEMYDNRFKEGGSLSSYYDNSKAINPLLDDADFKHKVLDKINDLKKIKQEFKETIDFVFSRDNLENIKIQVQDFKEGYYFDLVVYELYPPGESAPTEPSAGESAEPAADANSDESPVDGD